MTVAELIEKLREMPQEAEVVIDYDSAAERIEAARVVVIGEAFSRNLEEWDDRSQSVVLITDY